MPNPVVHFEIAGRDGETLEEFYSKLFGWTIGRRHVGGYPYGDVEDAAPAELTGGIRHEPEGEPEIVIYVGVPDVAGFFDRAQELGAGVRIPPMEAGELTFALIEDPEGNPIGLIEQG